MRYTLRTLLILLAVLALPCAWLGYSLRWIAERQAFEVRKATQTKWVRMLARGESTTAPCGLWLFGEKGTSVIAVDGDEEAAYARKLFPEAKIVLDY